MEDRRLLATSPFPVPLAAEDPLGSFIYRSSVAAEITGSDETDSFTIDLDDGQTVTLVVEPEAALQPTVELRDPDGNTLGTASADAAGEDALLQAVPTSGAGRYRIIVGGQSPTVGTYEAQLILNAAAENESHGGPANDDLASAEDLASSFIPLGHGAGQRGAVLGTLSGASGDEIFSEDFESGILDGSWTTWSSEPKGRIQLTGQYGTAEGSYALLMDRAPASVGGDSLNEAIWTVDLSGSTEAVLWFSHAEWSDELHPFAGDFTGNFNADGVAISEDGVHWHPVWDAPDQANGIWERHAVDLAVEAAMAGMTLGPDFQIKFQQYDTSSLTTDGRGYDDVALALPADDWYRFTLDDAETATLVLTKSAPEDVVLELYDDDGTLLSTGAIADDVTQIIGTYLDQTTDGTQGTYLARVQSSLGAGYHLVVARNADFHRELSDSLSRSQDVTLSGKLFGRLGHERSIERQKLIPSDAESGDRFGRSVAISGDTAIVGAPYDDDGGLNAGAAYILQWDGQRWIEQQKLIASDADEHDDFGFSVAISGNTAVVGAYDADGGAPNSGAAYVFQLQGTEWIEQQKLIASDADVDDWFSDHFGWSVAISGDTVIVGTIRDDGAGDDAGAAYVFRWMDNQWIERQKLIASDANVDDKFGGSVAISASTAIVGALGNDAAGSNAGAAYVFQFDGTQWVEQQKLIASDAEVDDLFGGSVAISDHTMIVGASGNDDGGANSGAAYVFQSEGGEWIEQQKLTASDAYRDDRFGRRVAISGSTVVVGAPNQDEAGSNSGAAYVFQWEGSQWVEQQKLIASDADRHESLGESMAISGDTVMVGAWSDNALGLDTGAAYVFSANSADRCTVNVQAGDSLTVSTGTPGMGPGEFVNTLDPAVELYGPRGALVAADDSGGPDRHNALLTHTAATSGQYTVHVVGANRTGGEYALSISGQTGGLPMFEATATDPADLHVLPNGQRQALIDFSDALLLTTLDASDVTIDGAPASRVTVVDGDTILVDLPGQLSAGLHELAIAGGAVEDVQATPIEPFSSQFVVGNVSMVVGRHLFYNDSAFDYNRPSLDKLDDYALTLDKTGLFPGQTATFANYTSYDKGINGVMVDIVNAAGNPNGNDFEFRVGNDDDPAGWQAAPDPQAIAVRALGGEGSPRRVTIVWNDHAIQNQWLEVTVKATERTGLAEPDVFYFGNAVGESGDSPTDARVNATDVLLTRINPRTLADPAPIDCPYDYNRDRRVNATDMLIARNNQTHLLNALQLISVPGSNNKAAKLEAHAAGDEAFGSWSLLSEFEEIARQRRAEQQPDAAEDAAAVRWAESGPFGP